MMDIKCISIMLEIDIYYLKDAAVLEADEKNPQPRHSIVTHRRVKEMFPFMENIEYKVGI